MSFDPELTKSTLNKGFEVSVRKTFNHPVNEIFDRTANWFKSGNRTELQHHLNQKRLNCKWLSDNSKIMVEFNKKSGRKTELVVQHCELGSETDADVMRNFWNENLPRIIESL